MPTAIKAGGDLTVESAQSQAEARRRAERWNAGVGFSASLGASGGSLGITAEGGFSMDRSRNWSETQVNAHLDAGGTATVRTGRDAVFAGAVVSGKNVALAIGGNLTVASRQDTAHGSSSALNGSGSCAMHDTEQTTKATVGEGTIVVRDKDRQKQEVADINRALLVSLPMPPHQHGKRMTW